MLLRTRWESFTSQFCQNPNVCLLFSARRVCLMLLQLYTGILPFMPLRETHLEIFMPVHMLKLVCLLHIVSVIDKALIVSVIDKILVIPCFIVSRLSLLVLMTDTEVIILSSCVTNSLLYTICRIATAKSFLGALILACDCTKYT